MSEFARYWIGVDLGQIRDSTAIAVVERAELLGEKDWVELAYRKEIRVTLRHLERVALGTPYPDIVEQVVELTEEPELRGRCEVVLDATGGGVPVTDMFRKAKMECNLRAVMITGGVGETKEFGFHHVPKRDLIVGLQVMLQERKLKIAGRLPYADVLFKELMDMQVKISGAGNELYGAWRQGQHDDLAFAVALASWAARKEYPEPLRGSDAYWILPPIDLRMRRLLAEATKEREKGIELPPKLRPGPIGMVPEVGKKRLPGI